MRFCDPPVPFESRAQLADIVCSFLPVHTDEGMSPLAVFKLPQVDEAWLTDRLARFHNFQRDPVGSKKRLSKICKVACSALAAVHAVGDDKQTHRVLATILTPVWYPLRIQFTLLDMASEAGWAPGRHVITWIPGTERLIWAKVVTVTSSTARKTVTVVIQAFTWSHEALNRAFEQHGRYAQGTAHLRYLLAPRQVHSCGEPRVRPGIAFQHLRQPLPEGHGRSRRQFILCQSSNWHERRTLPA
ncbi:hypothetical protein V3C99_017820 [Haemonchus contortus]